uniref:RCC1-like domain-containing protein n=1 Tax=Brassica campestris TaxID=3711 RepID=M4DED9_BRACM
MNGNNGGSVNASVVYMSGYLPGASPEKSPILSHVPVRLPAAVHGGGSWKDVCGGGCGFAMAISEAGEAFTWGWKECIPSKDVGGKQQSGLTEQGTNASSGQNENRKVGEEPVKRRRVSTAKDETEGLTSGEDYFATTPSLVSVGLGVRITSVATGGRHTLALSDIGQVWGWGYGGEGQLGLGSRIKMVSAPHLIPFLESPGSGKERSFVLHQGTATTSRVPGQYIKAISCGGRHSAAITDSGGLITFGWGLYGQCGHGNTNDQLRPMAVSEVQNVKMESVATGLWHTICISSDGKVFAFGGNQFGQLGTGTDHAETIPRLLDGQNMENKHAIAVSCGARHSAVLTDDGQLLCWGWNKYGQLGLGDTIDRNIPTQVELDGCRLRKVACGWWHTLLLADSPT